MVSTPEKKKHNKRLFSQLDESDVDFMVKQNNHEAQAGSKTNVVDRGTSSNKKRGSIQVKNPHMDMHTLEENIVSKVRSQVDNVMTTVKTTVQDAVLTAIENIVIPRVDLVMKSANASSARSDDGNVLEPDQKDFLGSIEVLQMTASGRIHSRTDLNGIDETRCNITVEKGDLLVNKRNSNRQTHTHHRHRCRIFTVFIWHCGLSFRPMNRFLKPFDEKIYFARL